MNTKLLLAIFAMLMLCASALKLSVHNGKSASYKFDEGPEEIIASVTTNAMETEDAPKSQMLRKI